MKLIQQCVYTLYLLCALTKSSLYFPIIKSIVGEFLES